MRRTVALILFLMVLLVAGTAFASLNDNRTSITSQYGEYRRVLDTDNQPWTEAEWETKGYQRATAASYMYSFTRNDLHFQMEVQYENNSPQSMVHAQRITPDTAIKVRELKQYLPEVYSLITSPKSVVFTTYKDITRNFQEMTSPVAMGAVELVPVSGRSAYYTLVAFNIQDEGRLIKDPKYIDENTYIREITIERVRRTDVQDYLAAGGDWKPIKSYF